MADPRIILLDEPAPASIPTLLETIIERIAGHQPPRRHLPHHRAQHGPGVLASAPACSGDGERAACCARATPAQVAAIPRVIDAYLGGAPHDRTRDSRQSTGSRPATSRACRSCAASASRASQGEIVAVLGPNGAGKSTLVKADRRPGADIRRQRHAGRPGHHRRAAARMIAHRGLGFVPQTENVFTPMSIDDNLQLAADILPKAAPRRADRRPCMACFPTSRASAG